jgi:hypothetical protein
LKYSSKCTGVSDCSVSLVASQRYKNVRNGCVSFWGIEEYSLLSGETL